MQARVAYKKVNEITTTANRKATELNISSPAALQKRLAADLVKVHTTSMLFTNTMAALPNRER